MSTESVTADADPLPVPDDFGFPFEPYDIQQSFMKHLFGALDQQQVGIFESPTGTGKSLSLLCGSVSWLLAHERRTETTLQARLEQINTRIQELDVSADWLAVHAEKMQLTESRDRLAGEADEQARLTVAVGDIRQKARRLQQGRAALGAAAGRSGKRTAAADAGQPAAGPADENDVDARKYADDDLLLDDGDKSDNADAKPAEPTAAEEPPPLSCTKIFFASRTHSQLEQFLKEIQRTVYARELRVVVLGSRQTLCVNDQVNGLGSVALINDRCLQMMDAKAGGGSGKAAKTGAADTPSAEANNVQAKSKCASTCKCPYNKATAIEDLHDVMLGRVCSVDQVKQEAEQLTACAYYAARKAVPLAQIVLLPYQILLHAEARKSWGIELKGNVVIIDEAHNLLDAVAGTYGTQLLKSQLSGARAQLLAYTTRFSGRLSARNLRDVQLLAQVMDKLLAHMDQMSQSQTGAAAECLTVTQFTMKCGVDDVNPFGLVGYLEASGLCRKLFGFSSRYAARRNKQQQQQPPAKCQSCQLAERRARLQAMTGLDRLKHRKQYEALARYDQNAPCTCVPVLPDFPTGSPMFSVKSFLEAIGCASDDGRIVCDHTDDKQPRYRFLLLNPGDRLSPVVRDARSVILAGGTMSPADELLHTLYRVCRLPEARVTQFSCQHVIDSSQLLTLCVPRGPVSNQQLTFTFEHRNSARVVADLGQLIHDVFSVVPGGTVVFFPSYSYMQQMMSQQDTLGRCKQLGRVFVEPRESNRVTAVLSDYSRQILKSTAARALLCAVVGGKMSEGINFSDALGRCVVMVGMPYANRQSPELVEKMKYLSSSSGQAGLGALYYDNLCLRAVNQSIGRAIRHRNDFAVVVLADARYDTPQVQAKLPRWIARDIRSSADSTDLKAQISQFFARQK